MNNGNLLAALDSARADEVFERARNVITAQDEIIAALRKALSDLVREIRACQSPECDDEDAIGAPELKAADAALALVDD